MVLKSGVKNKRTKRKREKIMTTSKIVFTAIVIGIAVIAIVLGVVLLGTRQSDCSNVLAPTDLVTFKTDKNITITWSNPVRSSGCSISYMIRYSIDDGQGMEENTTSLSYELPHLDTCSVLSIRIWTLNEAGELSNDYLTGQYREIPAEITPVIDIIFSPVTDGIQLTFMQPEGIEKCNAKYEVFVSTDITGITYETDSDSLVVTDDNYCFVIIPIITTIIDEKRSAASLFGEYMPSLESVSDLEISISHNTLSASWSNHPKVTQCDLQYTAIYRIENGIDEVVITSDTSAVFPMTYCVDANIFVTPFRDVFNGEMASLDATQYPTSIAEVQNIVIDVVNTTAITSWDLPDDINQCTIQHNVTAMNDENSEYHDTCIGSTSCTLALESFCPSTTFVITAIDIVGVTAQKRYTCGDSISKTI